MLVDSCYYFWSILFQLIVLLQPDVNYCNSFALSSVDKVTTGIQSFTLVIPNSVS